MKKTVKLTESELHNMIMESINEVMSQGVNEEITEDDVEDALDEGLGDNLKTGVKTFFKKSGSLGDKFRAAKKNFNTQKELDDLKTLRELIKTYVDNSQLNPNETFGHFLKFGGKINNQIGNRQSQINKRMQ